MKILRQYYMETQHQVLNNFDHILKSSQFYGFAQIATQIAFSNLCKTSPYECMSVYFYPRIDTLVEISTKTKVV